VRSSEKPSPIYQPPSGEPQAGTLLNIVLKYQGVSRSMTFLADTTVSAVKSQAF